MPHKCVKSACKIYTKLTCLKMKSQFLQYGVVIY